MFTTSDFSIIFSNFRLILTISSSVIFLLFSLSAGEENQREYPKKNFSSPTMAMSLSQVCQSIVYPFPSWTPRATVNSCRWLSLNGSLFASNSLSFILCWRNGSRCHLVARSKWRTNQFSLSDWDDSARAPISFRLVCSFFSPLRSDVSFVCKHHTRLEDKSNERLRRAWLNFNERTMTSDKPRLSLRFVIDVQWWRVVWLRWSFSFPWSIDEVPRKPASLLLPDDLLFSSSYLSKRHVNGLQLRLPAGVSDRPTNLSSATRFSLVAISLIGQPNATTISVDWHQKISIRSSVHTLTLLSLKSSKVSPSPRTKKTTWKAGRPVPKACTNASWNWKKPILIYACCWASEDGHMRHEASTKSRKRPRTCT